jgi:cell division transport system permease protein
MMEPSQLQSGEIIPTQAAPLRNLVVTMAVMCYLAALAIGALILINQAVESWCRGLSSEFTVQVQEMQNLDIEAEVAKAVALLQNTKGVAAAEALDRNAGLKLLEPWLGTQNVEELPIPRLIRVSINEQSPPDFKKLEQALKSNIKGSSLDTHRRWQAELIHMAHSLILLSALILFLICASAIAIVVFAARSVLDANRDVVEVLHLVGAKNGFIAHQIDKRFMVSGLTSGLIGVGLAILTFLSLGLLGSGQTNAIASASLNLIFAPTNISLWNYGFLLSVPIAATAIALLSARLTLMRMLKNKL